MAQAKTETHRDVEASGSEKAVRLVVADVVSDVLHICTDEPDMSGCVARYAERLNHDTLTFYTTNEGHDAYMSISYEERDRALHTARQLLKEISKSLNKTH